MRLRLLYLIILVAAVTGCNKKNNTSDLAMSDVLHLQYAKGFRVQKTDGYTLITIRNPWDTAAILNSYVLVDKQRELPANLPKGNIIRTPVSSVVATSALHCSILDELKSVNLITGVCEPQYIKTPYITEGVASGKIADLGIANSPDPEGIIMLNPDAVFSDPMVGKNQASLEKAKVPLVMTTDYTEPHPLGRAEWIRFYALFVGQETLADSLFTITAKKYNEVKNKVKEADKRPTVFTDIRYQGNWHLPGGQSNTATLLNDAGAAYIWADDESTVFITLTFETVLDKAGDADKWLIRYYDNKEMSYASLMSEYKPYSYFKAFKDKEIYTCNTLYSPYYDDLPIHPDYVLQDLAYVFHPELFPDYKARYYKKMEK